MKVFPEFNGWLNLIVNDAAFDYCKMSLKRFKPSNMGEQVIISHTKGPNHVKQLKTKHLQLAISFLQRKMSVFQLLQKTRN